MLNHLLLARLYMLPQQSSWSPPPRDEPPMSPKPAEIQGNRDRADDASSTDADEMTGAPTSPVPAVRRH